MGVSNFLEITRILIIVLTMGPDLESIKLEFQTYDAIKDSVRRHQGIGTES